MIISTYIKGTRLTFTEQTKRMSPIEFEVAVKDFLEQILKFQEIETTKIKGDFGADLIGVYENKKYVVQVKKYASPVNLKAVQEVYGSKSHYNADACMVVTNSKFTESAIQLADSTSCILVDGSDLDRLFVGEFESFDDQIEYLIENKIRSFRITNEQLISAYFSLKNRIARQPTIDDVDKLGDFSSSTYRKRWGKWNDFLTYIGEQFLVDRNISKENLVRDFVDVSNRLGRTPRVSDMRTHGKYSVSSYDRYFGTWTEFLKAQKIEPSKRHLIPKNVFFDEYRKVKVKLGRVPTRSEFDEHSEISSSSFRRIWGSWSRFLSEQGVQTRDIDNQKLIDEYWKLKEYLGKKSLTQADMNSHGRFSSSTYERRFGSWTKFLKIIGEKPNVDKDITAERLVEDYRRLVAELSKNELSANDIKEFSRFSLSTYIARFGSWNAAKQKCRAT